MEVIMATASDLIGVDAYSRDGVKIGKVTDALADVETRREFVKVKKRFSHAMVIPFDVIEIRSDSILVPFTSSFLDMAPRPQSEGRLTSQDIEHLDSFYRRRDAA
jgi:uncharacterized protein YrrD